MGKLKKALLYSLPHETPMLSILDSKDKTEAKRIIRRLNSYRKIYSYLGHLELFQKIAGNLYGQIKAGRKPRELPVDAVERKLREQLRNLFINVVEDLRNSGYGREADKIEEFVLKGEFKNAYLTLKELREMETRKEAVENLLNKIDDVMSRVFLLTKIGMDVEEVRWKIAELLGVNRIKIPEKKLHFINDESGNTACLLSTYLRRMGVEHTYISTKNFGDYWITFQNVPQGVNPYLKTGDLVEVLKKAEGLVIVEDLNYLILTNSFGEVYQFLQFVKNKVKAQVIFTGNSKMLSEREIARLRGLFDSMSTLHTLFNLCSWAIVGIGERKNKGSLLLSKVLVDDFEGEVKLVADFGGKEHIHPQRIDFEIADLISLHLREGDVVIDSIDLMIDENGIEKIYVWLKGIRDLAMLSGNRVYVVTRDLIAREKEYLRPLLDCDEFYLHKLDDKIIEAVSKKIEILDYQVQRTIEKESAYNMEIIRQKYEKYEKYLADLREEVETLLKEEPKFDLDFLVKTTPLRKRIEELTETIERKTREFNRIRDSVRRDIEIAKEYVDVEDIEYCIQSSEETLESGDIDLALDKVKVCRGKMDKLMEEVKEKAEDIYREIECVSYLLPAYFQSKLAKFKGGIEDIKEFTRLYRDLKRVLFEKVESEYSRLRQYSIVSGIPLPNLESTIKSMKLCEYRKERDQFMKEFEDSKDKIMEVMRTSTLKIIDFLEEKGYRIPVSRRDITTAIDFEDLFSSVERVYNHFSMFISKSIDDLRRRYPEYVKKYESDIEKIIVEVSINPLDAIHRYNVFMEKLQREIGEKNARMMEIKRRLKEYYSMMRSYNLPIQEWYPESVEEGEVVVSFLNKLFGEVKPDVDVNMDDMIIDDAQNLHIFMRITNTGNYEAKNVSIEVYGAIKSQEKIEVLKEGEERSIEICGKIEDPNENIKVDVFFEGVDGGMLTKSFLFEVNVKGYEISYATGSERCALCRGKIFKDSEMVVCSECGATYHRKCAERLHKCNICGNTFVF